MIKPTKSGSRNFILNGSNMKIFLLLMILFSGLATAENATLEYKRLYILRNILVSHLGDISFFMVEKAEKYYPEKLSVFIDSKRGKIPLKIAEDGAFDFPLDKGLLEESPLLRANRPQGDVSVKFFWRWAENKIEALSDTPVVVDEKNYFSYDRIKLISSKIHKLTEGILGKTDDVWILDAVNNIADSIESGVMRYEYSLDGKPVAAELLIKNGDKKELFKSKSGKIYISCRKLKKGAQVFYNVESNKVTVSLGYETQNSFFRQYVAKDNHEKGENEILFDLLFNNILSNKNLLSHLKVFNYLKHGTLKSHNSKRLAYLGACYLYGYGGERDYDKGIELLKEAVKQNERRAYQILAEDYMVKKQYEKAYPIIKKLSEEGCATSQYHYAMVIMYGKVIEKDLTECNKWLRKAAENGISLAQKEYAIHLLFGKGLKKDKSKAVEWLVKSAAQGDAESQFILGCEYIRDESLGKSEKEGIEMIKKSALNGYAEAQYMLGRAYHKGYRSIAQDYRKALFYFKKAAAQKYLDAEVKAEVIELFLQSDVQ